MHKGRLEAFSDGVIAIIITIMILELKVPHESDIAALIKLAPKFLTYNFSFIFVGIYWNNHHHLLQSASHVNSKVMWANLHLLFWLSMVPFVTGWVGETNFATIPVAIYGVVLLMAGIGFFILVRTLVANHGSDSVIARVLGNDRKGILAVAIYAVAIPLAFVSAWIAMVLFQVVSVMYLIPDKRIEREMAR